MARHKLTTETTRLQNRVRSLLAWAAPGMMKAAGGTVSTGLVHVLGRWSDLTALEERIAALHAELFPKDRLLSIPGIGPVVAGVIRGVVGDLSRFANQASFRAYTGLVPRENSSGGPEPGTDLQGGPLGAALGAVPGRRRSQVGLARPPGDLG